MTAVPMPVQATRRASVELLARRLVPLPHATALPWSPA